MLNRRSGGADAGCVHDREKVMKANARPATAATLHGNTRCHRGRVAPADAAVVAPESPSDRLFRANARSEVDWKRAAGVFSRHRSTARRSSGGNGRSGVDAIGAGASRRTADIASGAVAPVEARRPVSIS